MSDVVIRAEGLGKKYVIGHQGESERYTSLRDVLARSARVFARSARDLVGGKLPVRGDETTEDFWALKDVNFEIKRGEVVGIIGRNGAGKSTLLKILSRITEPTEGRVEIKGRVASLLEVGTGFHPELTGRENIYLNGAILGMSRAEIRRKFDEIVAFAETEKFLDTPVKRYSSGMYVRLAFAVAAHLEPEILVVDEVLAVGDVEFQKKCLGKMGEVAGQGRTVVFVSHNLSTVSALCRFGMYLKNGLLQRTGPVADVLREYVQSVRGVSRVNRDAPTYADAAVIEADAVYEIQDYDLAAGVKLSLTIQARKNLEAAIDVRLKDSFGLSVGYGSLGALDPNGMVSLKSGMNEIVIVLPSPRLAAGRYTISIDLSKPNISYYDRLEDLLVLEVEPTRSEVGVIPLKQSWGLGSIYIPMKLLTNQVKQGA
jgi:lipopolysaccharide transport system ATP-binding protein